MRNRLPFLLLVLFYFFAVSTFATTTGNGTARSVDVSDGVVVTGAVPQTNGTDWETDEVYAGFGGIINWYLTWDDDNLYIGRIGGNNSEGSLIYLRADFTGAAFTNNPQAYDGYEPNHSNVGGLNFVAYIKDTYDEFRTWNGAAWSAANTSLTPAFTTTSGDAHFEVAIAWNDITGGNGKPENIRAVLTQTTAGTFVYGESPYGDGAGNGGPTIGVNDGVPTSASPQPGGNLAVDPDTSITRWWGCYPIIGGVSSNGWNAQQPNAGNDTTLCQQQPIDTIQMVGNSPAADAVGTWTVGARPLGSAIPVADDVNDSATVFRNLDGFGTYEFIWSINYGLCPSTPDTITVTRAQAPDAANAGANETLACGDNETVLNGNDPVVGTGTWTSPFSANPTIVAPNDFDSDIEDLDDGENILVWTIENDPTCPANTDTMIAWVTVDPTANAGTDQELCTGTTSTTLTGNNPASIQSTATGEWTMLNGPAPATFTASQFNSPLTGLVNGVYQFEWAITNVNCPIVRDTVFINIDNEPSLSATPTPASCATASNGSIDLSVSSGTMPYTYVWSNGGMVEDISGLAPTTYTVTVTDNAGCANTLSQAVSANASPVTINDNITNASCATASDGAVDITPSNGTMPYTYGWSNGSMAEDISGLAVGDYTVTVTDNDNCSATNVSNVAAGTNAPNLTTVPTDASCATAADGAVNLTVSNGTMPYTYGWSNGSMIEDISGLGVGDYTVTVTDNNNCTSTTTETIAASVAGIALSAVITDASCATAADGAVNLTVSNGTMPYTYGWSNGSMVEDISGLAVGDYTVTVTDNNSCSATSTETVSAGTVNLGLSAVVTDASCASASDGAIDLTVSSGTMPYTYGWSNGSMIEDISSLAVGDYTVTVTDNNNCSSTATETVGASGGGFTLSPSVTDASCPTGTDGAIDLSVAGGSMPYTFAWNTGATAEDLTALQSNTYTVTVTDALSCTTVGNVPVGAGSLTLNLSFATTNAQCNGTSTGSIDLSINNGTAPYTYSWNTSATTEDIANVSAGTYTVSVTDAIGCGGFGNDTVTQPANLNAVLAIANAQCNGAAQGSITAVGSGGTQPYSYQWSNGDTTATADSLLAGTYFLTLTDANNCARLDSATILEPTAVMATLTTTNVVCAGDTTGTAAISATGGTMPFSFTWNNGSTAQTLSNLPEGIYTVTTSDFNGCSVVQSDTISAPGQLSISAQLFHVSCNAGSNGAIDISINGGTGPYTYLWNTMALTEDVSGLSAGAYSVGVLDADGCADTSNFTLLEPTPVTVAAAGDTSTCISGSAQLFATAAGGGDSSFAFVWSTGDTTTMPIMVSPSTNTCYYVTAIDSLGCTSAPDSICVNLLPPITITVTDDTTLCSGGTVTIGVSASGGTGGYLYDWSNGYPGPIQQVSPSGTPAIQTYFVTVSDGCSPDVIDSVRVAASTVPPITYIVSDTSGCAPDSIVFFGGGHSGISCRWEVEPGLYIHSCDSFAYTYATAGTYPVGLRYTTAEGCRDSTSFTITMGTAPQVEFEMQLLPGCDGIEGQFTGTTTNATSYLWTFNGSQTDTSAQAVFTFPYQTGMKAVLEASNGFCTDTTMFARTAGTLEEEFNFVVPNVFTPNGDNINDFFEININNRYQTCARLDVFNRWGETVFTSLGHTHSWDGRKFSGELATNGTYFYVLTIGGMEFKGALLLTR